MHRNRVLAAIGVQWQIHCFDLHEIKATRPQFGVNSLGSISLPKNVQNQTQTHTGINNDSNKDISEVLDLFGCSKFHGFARNSQELALQPTT